jgi:hypothetical protein
MPNDTLLKICLAVFALLISNTTYGVTDGYPKIMGMNIGNPGNYDDPNYRKQLSRNDVVVLNFWPNWKDYKYGPNAIRNIVVDIKKRNPNILVGQYTILNESQDLTSKDLSNKDRAYKLEKENWWLRDAAGRKAQWTKSYNAWDINITDAMPPDKDGLRYPQWLARRNNELFFKNIPEFDFWFLDNSLHQPPVKSADWQRKGVNLPSSNEAVAKAYRLGHVTYWETIRSLQPDTLLVGNSDNLSSAEYTQRLNGGFLEAMIGKLWSVESWQGWEAALKRYYIFMENTAAPKLVGFNVWGRLNDFQRMRYGLATCLLNDGYFSYTDESKGYTNVTWFDEFEVNLGSPLDSPPNQPWQSGVYRREFTNGLVLVNPTKSSRTIRLEPGFMRINGKQAPLINNGKPAETVTLGSKDGLVLVRRLPR